MRVRLTYLHLALSRLPLGLAIRQRDHRQVRFPEALVELLQSPFKLLVLLVKIRVILQQLPVLRLGHGHLGVTSRVVAPVATRLFVRFES